MIIATSLRQIAATLTIGLLCSTAVRSQVQDIYLSEVCANASEAWIEVHNRGTSAVNIGTWSLHCATATPGQPNNYWWGFPMGTILPANAYLRVHWFQDAPASPAPGNFYTGTSPFGFLFGVGGEPLSGGAGAAALLASQSSTQMISSSIVRDWGSWGASGFQRESLAITAGLWEAGRYVASIPAAGSIARDPGEIGVAAHPDESWFVDYTATPLAPNITGAAVQSYGNPCTLPGNHLLGQPGLSATSLPLVGNGQFGFALDNTVGIFGEYVLVAFSAGAAPPGLPSVLPQYAGAGCHESIDVQQVLVTWLLSASLFSTNIPLPLTSYSSQIIGHELHVQALVIQLTANANPPYQGLSNALRVVIGQ